MTRIPATVVTGFLGAGNTSLLRSVGSGSCALDNPLLRSSISTDATITQ